MFFVYKLFEPWKSMAESDSNSATSSLEYQQQNEESWIDDLEVLKDTFCSPISRWTSCSRRCFIHGRRWKLWTQTIQTKRSRRLFSGNFGGQIWNRVSVDTWQVYKVNFKVKFPFFISKGQTLVCFILHVGGEREYRCCKDIRSSAKDNGIWWQYWACYTALTNKTVLSLVGPLLRCRNQRNGRSYRRSANQLENEYLRAVAHRRWFARWICGPMGLESSRPLSVCV